jgi:hypothetical protein
MSEPGEPTEINLLMKEFVSLRQEFLFHFKEAKLPAKYLQIFIAGSVVMGYYLIYSVNTSTLSTTLGLEVTTRGLFICFLFLMNFTSYYFVFDILDSYFCMFLALARIINIEEHINDRLGAPLMGWESRFQLEKKIRFGTSRATITVLQIIIIFFFSLVLPIGLYVWMWFTSTVVQKILLAIAILACVSMFAWFIYACYRVMLRERDEAVEIMRRLSPIRGGRPRTRA